MINKVDTRKHMCFYPALHHSIKQVGGGELSGLRHGGLTHFFPVRVSKQLLTTTLTVQPDGELTSHANIADVFLARIQKRFM